MTTTRWPGTLWIVRHGESAGNVARDAAHASGAERITLATRDVDIPLSPRGEEQARALGAWFAAQPADARPEVMLVSPYVRAQNTAKLFRDAGGAPADEPVCLDERLREKEFGILDGLTTDGVRTLQPDQAEFRRVLGKFYHRPPGGESWCDVIFRLRSLLDTMALHYPGRRVMIVAHQVVVLCLRYVIENMTEAEILGVDAEGDVLNCSVTEYRLGPDDGASGAAGKLQLVRYNDVPHLTAPGPAEVTAEPERTAGVRGMSDAEHQEAIALDSTWIAGNPVPVHGQGTTKNSRGRVLAIGGSRMVPGALRLTGEAALRAGAGKLQMATIASAATMLGLLVPESGVIALDEDDAGEIGEAAAERLKEPMETCTALVIGPGMSAVEASRRLLCTVLAHHRDDLVMVIDAMPIGCAKDMREDLRRFSGRLILTPHYGEMRHLTGLDEEEIAADPQRVAADAAARFEAVVVLKGSDTVIAAPDGMLLHYGGGGTGLATGGSGDVLAGAIGGLLSRGADPLVAAGWGVWLHGQGGRRVATTRGPIGFLARELPDEFPRLLPQ